MDDRVFTTIQDYHAYTGRLASLAMAKKAQRGEITCAAPIGYKNAMVNGRKTVVIDEEVAPLIREAFGLAANGTPLRKILETLTLKGLQSRNGKVVGPSALWNLLQNPIYIGLLRYQGRELPLLVAGIVDQSVFTRVQTRIGSSIKCKANRF